MIRKLMLSAVVVGGMGLYAASPASARGWTYTGPHGATVTHWGWGHGPHWGWGPGPHWGPGRCCYGAGVAAGAVAGLAVGTAVGLAAAAHPPVVYAPPPVVYAPGYYYVP